jgi:hypothetical protein
MARAFFLQEVRKSRGTDLVNAPEALHSCDDRPPFGMPGNKVNLAQSFSRQGAQKAAKVNICK